MQANSAKLAKQGRPWQPSHQSTAFKPDLSASPAGTASLATVACFLHNKLTKEKQKTPAIRRKRLVECYAHAENRPASNACRYFGTAAPEKPDTSMWKFRLQRKDGCFAERLTTLDFSKSRRDHRELRACMNLIWLQCPQTLLGERNDFNN